MASNVGNTGPTVSTAPAGSWGGVEVVAGARRRISWGAVFAGVVMVIAVQLLLSMLGLGVGLGTVSPAGGDTPSATTLGLGAGLWWGISYLIALFVGGYVAARLAGRLLGWDGGLHGLLVWAFTLLVTFYLLTTAVGSVIGGAFHAVSATLSAAGQTVSRVAPQVAQTAGLTPDVIQQKARGLLNAQPSGGDPKTMSRDDAAREIATLLPRLAEGGPQAQQARDRILDIMSAQLNISRDEAQNRLNQAVGQAQQTVNQAADTARQAADKAASGLSRASLAAFVALVLGAIAAAWGGHVGARARLAEPEPIDVG